MLFGNFDTIFALGVGLNLSYLVFPQIREVIISLALSSIEDLIKELNLWLEDETFNSKDPLYEAIRSQLKTVKDQLKTIKQRSALLAMKFSYISFIFSLLCIVLLYYCILKGQEEVTKLKLFTIFSALFCFAPFVLFSIVLWFYLFKNGKTISSQLKFIRELTEKVKNDIKSATKELEEDEI